jgi:uncharacterized hydrophobic protein (TIGR00271 family)
MLEEGETPENQEGEAIKEELKFSFRQLLVNLVEYFKNILNIRDGVDVDGSIESIKKDIDFKGPSLWVLGASIVIASIGLNVNSGALIIGAMLISPLMGPIMGVGLSIGTNDWTTLIRSLKSLGSAVLISLVASTIYFMLTPFGEVQSELIARTRPNLLDVIVAILGGIAGIVAVSSKKNTNVIPGVAIATALMPPLCTAGYGLANGNWAFFFGAFYLFLINSVFITLSTWLIVKYLRFPLKKYLTIAKQKKMQRYILVFSLIIILPSGFTFWDAIQESVFKNNANSFLIENFAFESTEIVEKKLQYHATDTSSVIQIYLIGEILSDKTERELKNKMNNYNLSGVQLKIHQSNDNSDIIAGKIGDQVKSGILEEIYKKNELILSDKNAKISFLENELIRYKGDTIPFTSLKNEIKVQYPQVLGMTYGKTISTNFKTKQDTFPAFFIQWDTKLSVEEQINNQKNVENWLKVRLNDKKVRVINY